MRFIELMPVDNAGDWGEGFPAQPDRYFSVQEMLDRLRPRLGGLYGDTPRGRQDVPEWRMIAGRRAISPSPRTRAPPASVNGEGH